MKSGYSLLLGEYIEASHIEYTDCKSFQIVCPSCYEPVFKVSRELVDKSVNYLSHYPETKAVPEECELRVKGITKEHQEKQNSEARNQRLEYFLSVLREMIGKHPMYPHGYQKAQTKLRLSKALGIFRDAVYGHQLQSCYSRAEFYPMCDDYIKDIDEMGGVVKTAFSISVQKRIAFDIWMHLMSHKGRKNYDFLFNHAFLVLLSRMSQANESGDWNLHFETMANYLTSLMDGNKKHGLRLMSEMAATPVGQPYAIKSSNYLNKIAAEVTHEIIGTLISLPYFEYLRETSSQRA